jgi:F-box and WD-40 domain protein 5
MQILCSVRRFLYVNSRAWPTGATIENPLYPPPIAQEIDVHVIDLTTMLEVGTWLKGHKAFTSNDECFFIFLDVSDKYVARFELLQRLADALLANCT